MKNENKNKRIFTSYLVPALLFLNSFFFCGGVKYLNDIELLANENPRPVLVRKLEKTLGANDSAEEEIVYDLKTPFADDIKKVYNELELNSLLNPYVTESLALVESEGNPKIYNKSGSGATGIMQLMPSIYRRFSDNCSGGILDSYCNLKAGTNCLSYILDLCENYSGWEEISDEKKLSIAVGLYNWGITEPNPEKGKMKSMWNYVVDGKKGIPFESENQIKKFWKEMGKYSDSEKN